MKLGEIKEAGGDRIQSVPLQSSHSSVVLPLPSRLELWGSGVWAGVGPAAGHQPVLSVPLLKTAQTSSLASADQNASHGPQL